MKKILNKMLSMLLVGFILIIVFGFLSVMYYDVFAFSKIFLDSNDPILLSFGFIFAAFAEFIGLFLYVILVIAIPADALVAVFILQGISRLLYLGDEKDWKNKISRIIIYISIVILVMLGIYMIFIFIASLNLLLLLSIAVIVVLIVCFIKELKVIKNINK